MNRIPRTIAGMVVAVVCGLIATASVEAQSDYSNRRATSHLTVGPGIAIGGSLLLSPPEFFKVAPRMGWRFGADASYPLSPSVSGMLGLGIDRRTARLRGFNSTELFDDTHISYFALTPGFSFSSFYIGFNFGFPIGASYTTKAGPNASEVDSDMPDAQYDKILTIVEPRIGAVIPLLNDQNGWLALTLMGSITLGEYEDRGTVIDDSDFHMVSGHLGLTYQFAIPGTGK